MKNILILISCSIIFINCQKMEYDAGTFGYEVERLQAVEGLEILQDGDAMIAVSGIYQGRVFTSSAKGMHGKAYGWFKSEDIANGSHADRMASLGGESRLWFGPEFGEFSLFFEKDTDQAGNNMILPYDLNHKKFTEIKRSAKALTFGGQLELKNAQDYVFEVNVERTISLLSKDDIEKNLKIKLSEQTAFVGFSAANKVTNISDQQFKKETGLISIWELGCMLATADNWVIIPLAEETDQITEYFTPIADRMQIRDNVVFYNADADGINKIGIPPEFCKNIMGGYSASTQQLNIVTFSFEQDSLYVNSVPENTSPYEGDVINIFNGEVNPDLDLNYGFYEFESSSSARELEPNEHFSHRQTTYHFQGSFEELNTIAEATLGVSLSEVPEF